MVRNHHMSQDDMDHLNSFRRIGRLRSLQVALVAAPVDANASNISGGDVTGIRRYVQIGGLTATSEDVANIAAPGQRTVVERMAAAAGVNIPIGQEGAGDINVPQVFTWEGLTPLQTALASIVDLGMDPVNLTALQIHSLRAWAVGGTNPSAADDQNQVVNRANNGEDISIILRMRRSIGTPDPPGLPSFWQ